MSVTAKIGRNDPCYCGSGKKYKRCHLPIDEKARLASRPSPPARLGDSEEDIESQENIRTGLGLWAQRGELPRFNNPSEVFKWAKQSSLFKRDPEVRRLFEENGTLFNYLGSEKEIEAAIASLEPHEEEFRKLFDDEAAFLQRSEKLFDEEAFVPLRFSAADVERAFRQVGFPADQEADEDLSKCWLEAILFLASSEHRNHLSMELMVRLPNYVEEGRFLDARLVAFAAQTTVEDPQVANPFLVRMFTYGFEDWENHRQEERKLLLLELGLDLNPGSGPEEIDACVAQLLTDPTKAARLEQLQVAHPGLFSSSAPSLETTARQSVKILEREDAKCLWLSRKEIEPWVPFLMEKLNAMLEKYGPEEDQLPILVERQKEAFCEIYLPAMRDVAKSIFTSERVRKLIGDLRAYRNRLFAAGEKTASFWAMSAIHYVDREDDPSQNVFLVNLCAKSIHGAGDL